MIFSYRKWFAGLLVAVAGLASLPSLAQDGPRPWFAFTSRDDEALRVIERYFQRGDFLNINSARKTPELRQRIGKERLFRLSPDMKDVAEWAGKPCNDHNSASIIMYDIEEWEATSREEKADVAGSVRKAGDVVRGSGCRTFGLVPSRAYLAGTQERCALGLGQLPRNVQWRDVSVFVIQAQGLLQNDCVRKGGFETYRRFVADMTRIARAGNPDIIVLAEVSFNRGTPQNMVEAMEKTRSLVDGFYLAYPAEQERCRYCTPSDLEYVLSKFRRPVGR